MPRFLRVLAQAASGVINIQSKPPSHLGFLPRTTGRRLWPTLLDRPWILLRVGILLLLSTLTSHAHDPYVSTTDIWLRPDNLEVDIVMNRTLYHRLLENPPSAALTDDNFDSPYHALLLKCAPSLLEITVDGVKLEPRHIEVSLPAETDLQFTYMFKRPTGTQLHVAALFVKKMDVGFMNSLVLNDGHDFHGYGEQTADKTDWEIKLPVGADRRTPSSPAPTPTGFPGRGAGFAGATLILVILLAAFLLRQKFSGDR